MLPIREIAGQLEIPENYLEYYGKYTAKLRLELLSEVKSRHEGKLILVTAMTPTSHGEGKTVVSIGLAQAIQRLGSERGHITEPSLGPVFGVKGGAGGGNSRAFPVSH
jgi:formate--tetrahydrofolate ligase